MAVERERAVSATKPARAEWQARLGAPISMHFAAADEARDLSAHVRAASGIRRWGERLVIVQDDVSALAWLDERDGTIAPIVLPADADGRRSFSEARGNKASKMDIEACVVLPDDRFVAFGSGSTAARERIVLVDREHRVRVVDGHALYEHLRASTYFSGSELNLEGAVVSGERLRLFQRGNGAVVGGRAPTNAIGDLELAAFVGWLDGSGPPPTLVEVLRVDLGRIEGVPFGFTDATALPDGRIVFLVGAEDSPDTYQDGAVLGTRIGLLDGDHLETTEVLDPGGAPTLQKLEGVDFVRLVGDAIELVVVADMDDPDLPSVLLPLIWGPC